MHLIARNANALIDITRKSDRTADSRSRRPLITAWIAQYSRSVDEIIEAVVGMPVYPEHARRPSTRRPASETKHAFRSESANLGRMLVFDGAWWVITTVAPACGSANLRSSHAALMLNKATYAAGVNNVSAASPTRILLKSRMKRCAACIACALFSPSPNSMKSVHSVVPRKRTPSIVTSSCRARGWRFRRATV